MKKRTANKAIGERGTAHLAETVKNLEKRVADLERQVGRSTMPGLIHEEREYRDDPEINQIVRESREDYKAGRFRPARDYLAELQARKR